MPAPRKKPGRWYVTHSLDNAISRAVARANRRRERMAGAGNYDPVPHWAPNQLRHAHATEVRRVFGLEAAQAALGQANANVTQLYAERDFELARRVAEAIG